MDVGGLCTVRAGVGLPLSDTDSVRAFGEPYHAHPHPPHPHQAGLNALPKRCGPQSRSTPHIGERSPTRVSGHAIDRSATARSFDSAGAAIERPGFAGVATFRTIMPTATRHSPTTSRPRRQVLPSSTSLDQVLDPAPLSDSHPYVMDSER